MSTTAKENPDLLPCPCCGKHTITSLGEYEICDVCGWEDDPIQSAKPDYAGGANKLSLHEARREWLSKIATTE